MKKLIAIAAVATLATGAFAEDTAAAPAAETPAAPAAAEAAKPQAPRGFDRAKYEERMKQRRLEQKAKVVEILTAAGVPAEKADATAEEIEGVYRPQRRPRSQGKRPPRPPRRPGAKAAPQPSAE